MKRNILALIFTIFISTISIAQNPVIAPRINYSIPALGDCNVDPGLTKIVITFDQEMSPGFSFPDTKNMPQITGKPEWKDKRTLSIPVKLYPAKLYSLQLNNWKFQGFKSIEGVPLNPEDLIFQTKSITYEELNKKAFSELKKVFPSQYSYASIKGIDWVTLLEKNRAELENAKTDTEFALKLITMFKEAEDLHLWVEVEGQRFETGKMKLVESNSDSEQLFELLQNVKTSNGFSSIAGVIDQVGYISIRDWNTDFNKLQLKPWDDSMSPGIAGEDALCELFKYPNLIVDVRENSGGNESFAKEFASCFVKDSIPYEKVVVLNEKTGRFDSEFIKVLYPSKKNLYYTGNIYVLSGPPIMSSNESFILMMNQVPNAKVVGMKTYGSSGNPAPYELSNGVTVYIPSWQAYTLEGKLIEGNGIDPDIEIRTSRKDFENNDPLIEAVLKMIKNKD